MIVWLLPVLFMIHDFEELIMINVWKKRNKNYIEELKAQNKKVPYDFSGSTASYAIGIFEEFIIISVVTLLSYLFNNYILWYGLFIAVTLHFFAHIYLYIKFKRYVPGNITTIIFTPIFCLMTYELNILLHYNAIISVFSILFMTSIVLINLRMLHKIMERLTSALNKYSSELSG